MLLSTLASAPNVTATRPTCPRWLQPAVHSARTFPWCPLMLRRRSWWRTSAPTLWSTATRNCCGTPTRSSSCCTGRSRGHRATPSKLDNPDDRLTRDDHQVRGFRHRDDSPDGVLVLHLRAVPNRLDKRVFGTVLRCVAVEARTDGAGRRCPGGHGQQR